MMFAGFVILVCGLAALLYFVSVRRGLPPERPEQDEKSTASCETTSARRADGDITVASGSCADALADRADLS